MSFMGADVILKVILYSCILNFTVENNWLRYHNEIYMINQAILRKNYIK